ncbi:Cys-tRNA(Pro) deacylase [Keratinibaculum paraultunense]|nr:Cys-tRNA(Pro) deacylase [Keratinibaculum paraultunense]
MSKTKTNAIRILENYGIRYNVITYDNNDGKIDGVSVSQKIGKSLKEVFKTLVAQGESGNIYIFIIPVSEELDLKKAAKMTGEKKVGMLPVKDITKYTGYIRGGCSPIGMKKDYPTFIHESALNLDTIVVSGGKIGVQIELSVDELQQITNALVADLIK